MPSGGQFWRAVDNAADARSTAAITHPTNPESGQPRADTLTRIGTGQVDTPTRRQLD